MLRSSIAILFLVFFCHWAKAQESQLSTDRLNFVATTDLVKKNQLQFETGYHLTKTDLGNHNIYYAQLPSVQTRYGLGNRVELRLNITSAAVFARNHDSYSTNYYQSGIEGPMIGAKIKLLKQKQLIPNVSVLPSIKLQPLASRRFRRDYIKPTLFVLISHDLPAQIRLGYNLGSSWDEKFYLKYNLYIQKKWGHRFISNINFSDQWFAPDETGPNKRKTLCSNFGYYFTDKILADIGFGWGIENAPDNFYKVGVSFRL